MSGSHAEAAERAEDAEKNRARLEEHNRLRSDQDVVLELAFFIFLEPF